MSARCPVTKKACSTAYGNYGCRCGACRSWNAEHSRKRRDQLGGRVRVYRWPKETLISTRMAPLWAEADEAFRTDPAYIIALARGYHQMKALELRNSQH